MSAGRDETKPERQREYSTTVMAVDKRTGAVRWEVPGGPGGCTGGSHGDHMPPVLVRLGDRAVVVSNKGGVLDPETGATLAQLPIAAGIDNKGVWGTGFLTAIGNQVLRGSAGDNFSPPVSVWPMQFNGKTLEVGTGFVLPGAGQGSFSVGGRLAVIDRKVCEWSTRKQLAQLPREVSGETTLAGNLLISPRGHDRVDMTRSDLLSIADFSVIDMSDPTAPRTVSTCNRLGDSAMCADIADKYFPEFRKPELRQFALGGYNGIGAYFGHRLGGVTAQGERLYIRSQSHLYCVGPALKGTPSDDPRVVAAIRAAKSVQDLAKYLTHDSAQYRYEAVQRVSSLGNGQAVSSTLEALAKSDPYEDIRAVAYEILGLAPNQPGAVILWDLMQARADLGERQRIKEDALMLERLLLRRLGAAADPLLITRLKETEVAPRLIAQTIIADRHNGGSAALAAALGEVFAATKNREEMTRCAEALASWSSDSAVTAMLQSKWKDAAYESAQAAIFGYLRRQATTPDQQIRFLSDAIGNPNRDTVEWACGGLGSMAETSDAALDALAAAGSEGGQGGGQAVRSLAGIKPVERATAALLKVLASDAGAVDAALAMMGNDIEAEKAVKRLQDLLAGMTPEQRETTSRHFVDSFQYIRGENTRVVACAILTGLLKDGRPDTSNNALEGLRRMGANALPALPALKAANAGGNAEVAKRLADLIAGLEKASQPKP
jgi:hypothetical protein